MGEVERIVACGAKHFNPRVIGDVNHVDTVAEAAGQANPGAIRLGQDGVHRSIHRHVTGETVLTVVGTSVKER